MKSNKKKLKNLTVNSFVTSMGKEGQQTAKGGANVPTTGGCLTVISQGIWTVCCDGDNSNYGICDA